MSERIIVERQSGIGTITLNRPRQHNAIDYDMWLELGDAAQALGDDDDVRVVILTGAGERAFSAGADIKDFPAYRSSSSLARQYATAFEGALDAVEEMPKPVISMIRGICVGGGCELATATDLRIAATGSTFGVPIAKIGVLAGYREMRRLVRLVGPGGAMDLLLTARIVDEQEALRMGLVTAVVPAADLISHTHALAAQVAAHSPLSHRGHKRIMRTLLRNPTLQGLTDEEAAFPLSIFDTEDGMEGYQAFVESRAPRFNGR